MLGRFVDGTEGLTEAGWLVRSRIPLVYVAGIMDDALFRAVRTGGWRLEAPTFLFRWVPWS